MRETRIAPRQLRRVQPHVANASDRLQALLETARDGLLEASLLELATESGCDVESVRWALTLLEPTDHVLSVDVRRVATDEPFAVVWAPVADAVDLMLDWDLLELEITVAELAEWLGVCPAVTRRALAWLAVTDGVAVDERADDGTVSIVIDLDTCPLTAETSSVAG